MDQKAIIERAQTLMKSVLSQGVTIRAGNELQVNPAAEELDRLVFEYGLILEPGVIRFPECTSAPS